MAVARPHYVRTSRYVFGANFTTIYSSCISSRTKKNLKCILWIEKNNNNKMLEESKKCRKKPKKKYTTLVGPLVPSQDEANGKNALCGASMGIETG